MRPGWPRTSRRRDPVIGVATFALGPFHPAEASFRSLTGVLETAVGYTGGTRPSPRYEEVVAGRTGHFEAVQVEFDPSRVFYAELLAHFWRQHDPTVRPLAPRHRSIVFTHTSEQHRVAHASLLAAQAAAGRQLLTQIRRAGIFYRAEDEHQQALERRGLVPAFA